MKEGSALSLKTVLYGDNSSHPQHLYLWQKAISRKTAYEAQ